jgi:hypothetical protein
MGDVIIFPTARVVRIRAAEATSGVQRMPFQQYAMHFGPEEYGCL